MALIDKNNMLRQLRENRAKLLGLLLAAVALWGALYPRAFVALWLTPDQQGRLLFELGHYSEAAAHFQSPLWQGMSLYGGEEFAAAARLFSQYPDRNGLLAYGNALAHGREYVPAAKVYRQLLQQYPGDAAATVNLAIVQARIDENQRMSESQQAEAGEQFLNEEDGPKSSEGDERRQVDMTPKQQLTADQLLQDPALTEMWMRQVQKDPSRFLQLKFYMQLENRQKAAPGRQPAASEQEPTR